MWKILPHFLLTQAINMAIFIPVALIISWLPGAHEYGVAIGMLLGTVGLIWSMPLASKALRYIRRRRRV